MSNIYFPVTSGDPDYGTTMRRYLFNDASSPNVDDSVNNVGLVPIAASPNYGINGYGAALKGDATDLGIGTAGTNTAVAETTASVTQQDTTEMTIEVICKMDSWNLNWGCALSCVNPASRGSYGYEIAIGYSDALTIQAGFDGGGQWANRKFGTSYTVFPISAGDWVMFWLVWNSTAVGDAKIRLFGGNLSTTTTNVVESLSISGSPTGFAAASTKLAVGGRNNGTLSRTGTYLSDVRIQNKAFADAIIEARYDEIKSWTAPVSGSPIFSGLVGRSSIIGG